uniref:dCTP pyrophosphatase 1 n=1 Tax=Oryzias latipes TaxID=8090 RepID=A0A3P9L403_ORYLA
ELKNIEDGSSRDRSRLAKTRQKQTNAWRGPLCLEISTKARFTFSPEPTIEDIRRMQAEFTDERDWSQFHQPRNLLLAMVGEVGEVAELFQWRGEVAEGLPGWTESEREQLAHELSDVMIYLVELAEKCRVDLPQAVLRKMALNKLKYPASKVHGSAKKYTEYKD